MVDFSHMPKRLHPVLHDSKNIIAALETGDEGYLVGLRVLQRCLELLLQWHNSSRDPNQMFLESGDSALALVLDQVLDDP